MGELSFLQPGKNTDLTEQLRIVEQFHNFAAALEAQLTVAIADNQLALLGICFIHQFLYIPGIPNGKCPGIVETAFAK